MGSGKSMFGGENWREGVLPAGPVGLGPGEIDHESGRQRRLQDEKEVGIMMESMRSGAQALEPQLIRETATKSAKVAAEETTLRVLAEEKRRQEEEAAAKKNRLRPFFSFMDSLKELAEAGAGGTGEPGRTELVLKLYRLEETGGPKAKRIFQTQLTLDQAAALSLGDPGFEERTQRWALQASQWGSYEWRIQGWADGEPTLDTTYAVHVEPPPGHEAPARSAHPVVAEEARPVPPDPLQQLTGVLGVARQFREALGLGAPDGGGRMDAVQVAMIQQAAENKARFEESEKRRRELDDLRERHRKDLEEAEQRGLDRGRQEAKRDLQSEHDRQVWELSQKVRDLEQRQGGEVETSMVSEVVGALGGPQAVQGLVGALLGGLSRPAPAPGATRTLPPPQAARAVAQTAVPAPQVTAAVAPTPPQVPAAPEPSRSQHHDAMGQLEHALSLLEVALEERPDQRDHITATKQMLQSYLQEGLQDGSLARWWASWPQMAHLSASIIQELDTDDIDDSDFETKNPETIAVPDAPANHEDENPMDYLKALLLQRLDEGATDDAILAETRAKLSQDQLQQLREGLQYVPEAMLGALMGATQHQARLGALRDKLCAA